MEHATCMCYGIPLRTYPRQSTLTLKFPPPFAGCRANARRPNSPQDPTPIPKPPPVGYTFNSIRLYAIRRELTLQPSKHCSFHPLLSFRAPSRFAFIRHVEMLWNNCTKKWLATNSKFIEENSLCCRDWMAYATICEYMCLYMYAYIDCALAPARTEMHHLYGAVFSACPVPFFWSSGPWQRNEIFPSPSIYSRSPPLSFCSRYISLSSVKYLSCFSFTGQIKHA